MIVLLRLLLPRRGEVALAIALGALVVASNMGLLAAAAYLIAAASVTHLMALLVLPMYAVRILSVTRGSARYFERLVSHRATFDVLARLRVRLFDGFRRRGPAGMQGTHSGDALGRVMADVEDLQNAYLLVLSPIAVALAVSALCFGVLLLFSATIAWATAGYLFACGVLVPLGVSVLSRRHGHAVVESRADLHAQVIDSIQGSRDILANAAGPKFLEAIRAQAQRMARAERGLAYVSGTRLAAGCADRAAR